MHTEYHRWHSPSMGHDMEMKLYGHGGKPMLVLPCSEGRFFDYEEFGMIHHITDMINAGQITVYCIDTHDHQTWFSPAPPHERGHRYNAWQAYAMGEVVPMIQRRHHGQGILAHGCSFGAFHAANLFFKNPGAFDGCLLFSGVYSLEFSVGEHYDDEVYFNDPTMYLPNLGDDQQLNAIRGLPIIICCGQGQWEEWSLDESRRLSHIMENRSIEHWYDEWGHDVSHDWPWWHQQIRYFLPHFGIRS